RTMFRYGLNAGRWVAPICGGWAAAVFASERTTAAATRTRQLISHLPRVPVRARAGSPPRDVPTRTVYHPAGGSETAAATATLVKEADRPHGARPEQRDSEDPFDRGDHAGQRGVRPDQRVGGDVHAVAGHQLVVRGRV